METLDQKTLRNVTMSSLISVLVVVFFAWREVAIESADFGKGEAIFVAVVFLVAFLLVFPLILLSVSNSLRDGRFMPGRFLLIGLISWLALSIGAGFLSQAGFTGGLYTALAFFVILFPGGVAMALLQSRHSKAKQERPH